MVVWVHAIFPIRASCENKKAHSHQNGTKLLSFMDLEDKKWSTKAIFQFSSGDTRHTFYQKCIACFSKNVLVYRKYTIYELISILNVKIQNLGGPKIMFWVQTLGVSYEVTQHEIEFERTPRLQSNINNGSHFYNIQK